MYEQDQTTPSQRMTGYPLEGDWIVREPVRRAPVATGGCFSHGYIVERKDGTRGYLKALDYSAALRTPDPASVLQQMVSAFNFERAICDECSASVMDRVVRAIGSGTVRVDPARADGTVQYLIFELAEGDIRSKLHAMESFDLAWAFRTLHNVAVGLQQLHSRGIAHQDLKPSNVLVFDDLGSKVGDLGRAAWKRQAAPHQELAVAGDKGYAPPELLYDHIDPDWTRRRLGCDTYLLGSLVAFMFAGVGMTAVLQSKTAPEHRWHEWGGTFVDVLPYLREGFNSAVDDVLSATTGKLREAIETLLRELCEPDPLLRGRPGTKGNVSSQFSLEYYISHFDLLSKKSRYGLLK